MLIEVKREVFTDISTIGKLYVDGAYECVTLEDPVRDLGPNGEGKVWGNTAIPAGSYQVIVNMSPKFKKLLPRLLNVPFFDGILIHKGNNAGNTHGCLLVGTVAGVDVITQSTAAFNSLFPKITDALDSGDSVTCTITDEPV